MIQANPTPPVKVHPLTDFAPFLAWLHRQPAERSLYTWACPLAWYLHDQGYPRSTVGTDFAYLDGCDPATLCELPRWARAFTRAVDAQHGDVTPIVAIAVLEGILADFADRERPMGFEDWRALKGAA